MQGNSMYVNNFSLYIEIGEKSEINAIVNKC